MQVAWEKTNVVLHPFIVHVNFQSLGNPREVFNNFLWFNMRPLSLVLSEEWKDLDEKAWVEKYRALSKSIFRWKALWVSSPTYLMSCGSKARVSLIGLTSYINYSPYLVTR